MSATFVGLDEDHTHEHSHSHGHDHEHAHSHGHDHIDSRTGTTRNKEFSVFFLYFMVGVVVLYATCVDYATVATNTSYARFQDVQVMVFIGLGFLLAASGRSGLTATGHSYMIACFVILWYILCKGFFQSAIPQIPKRVDWKVILLDYDSFVSAEFCALAVIVSFGAVFGRLTGSQLLVMGALETIFFAFNEVVVKSHLKAADVGAGFYVHVFASIFGVAVATLANRSNATHHAEHVYNHSSETLAFLGTALLYCFYPSWNSVAAYKAYFAGAAGISENICVVNTVLALASSTVVTYSLLVIMSEGRVNAIQLQRAALAGGIAIAASANFNPGPFAAIIIGAVSAIFAILSFQFVQPILKRFDIHDSNGVFSAHFVPAIVGALTSIIVARVAIGSSYRGTFVDVFPQVFTGDRTARQQAEAQLGAFAVSLGFGLFGGLLTGTFLQLTPGITKYHDDEVEYHHEE